MSEHDLWQPPEVYTALRLPGREHDSTGGWGGEGGLSSRPGSAVTRPL